MPRFSACLGLVVSLLCAAPLNAQTGVDAYGVEMPSELLPGAVFPTPEAEIDGWVFSDPMDVGRIARHGWGLWAAVMRPSGVSAFGIPNARIYQTWRTPEELRDLPVLDGPRPVLVLRPPVKHGMREIDPGEPEIDMKIDGKDYDIVAFSPRMARAVREEGLLWTQTLEAALDAGATAIPALPWGSVSIEAGYKLITPGDLTLVDGRRLYAMWAWPGIPPLTSPPLSDDGGFPAENWGQCVYIDVDAPGPSRAAGVDPGCDSPGAGTIYHLADFVHIPIDGADHRHFSFLDDAEGKDLRDGGWMILVALHLRTKETRRWTWQTYWWAPDPHTPHSPSSRALAAARPKALPWEQRHYAMAQAYAMLAPPQPLVGGEYVGALRPVFNPHLEAFAPEGMIAIRVPVQTPEGAVVTKRGVETNCMTCHSLAAYRGAGDALFGANFYVPLGTGMTTGALRLDYTWALQQQAGSKPE